MIVWENVIKMAEIQCFFIEDINKWEEEIPVGAMWYVDHYLEHSTRNYGTYAAKWIHAGPDGHALCINTPGGHWIIDSRCSNCALPQDDNHVCWARSGEVPNITVTKGHPNENGSGSIQCGSYHGWLKNGKLVDA